MFLLLLLFAHVHHFSSHLNSKCLSPWFSHLFGLMWLDGLLCEFQISSNPFTFLSFFVYGRPVEWHEFRFSLISFFFFNPLDFSLSAILIGLLSYFDLVWLVVHASDRALQLFSEFTRTSRFFLNTCFIWENFDIMFWICSLFSVQHYSSSSADKYAV